MSAQQNIETISHDTFHNTTGAQGFPGLHEEREWFKLGNVYGVVIFDQVDKDWSHVVMAYDKSRKMYAADDLGVSAPTIEDARGELHRKMRALHLKKESS